MTNIDRKQDIFKTCTRFLSGSYPQTPQQVLRELSESIQADELPDMYGAGAVISDFEAEIARLLGKEAAVFMPSGTMCQQIALRIWTDRQHVARVGYHPTSHLEAHEYQAAQRLHNLQSVLIGSPYKLMTLADLQAVKEPLGALLLELPQREIGGQLPGWDELTATIAWAREQNIPTHLDGARLWESRPYYQRDYSEIASLFDTVYVSFYKSLGGIAGAVLAGPADVIAEARVWQRRHGGNLIKLYPYIVSARKCLAERLGRMDTYCQKAKDIAAALSTIPQIEIMPNPPQTNMMHLFFRSEPTALLEASLAISEETGIWLLSWLAPSQIPAYQKTELTVGDATLDLPDATIVELFQEIFKRTEQTS